MYGTANTRGWIRHMRLPKHERIVHVQKMLLSNRLWSMIGIVALALAFILVIVWAAETGRIAITEGAGPPYPNPLSGP